MTPGASYEEDDEDDEEEGVESREMISFSAFRSRVRVTESPEPMAPTAHAFAHGCETDSPQPPPVGPDAAPVHHTAPPPSNKAAERTANAAAWQRAVAKGVGRHSRPVSAPLTPSKQEVTKPTGGPKPSGPVLSHFIIEGLPSQHNVAQREPRMLHALHALRKAQRPTSATPHSPHDVGPSQTAGPSRWSTLHPIASADPALGASVDKGGLAASSKALKPAPLGPVANRQPLGLASRAMNQASRWQPAAAKARIAGAATLGSVRR